MLFDETLMITYASELRQNFNNLSSTLGDIETAFDKAVKIGNWNSPTREYFSSELNDLKNEFEKAENLFLNINNYLSSVIENYQMMESNLEATMAASFNNFGG